MNLLEELKEASVAATGHHADLLRRAAEYVSGCENQKPHRWMADDGDGGDEYNTDNSFSNGCGDGVPLYLRPSPPQSEEIAELRRQVLLYESMVSDRDERIAELGESNLLGWIYRSHGGHLEFFEECPAQDGVGENEELLPVYTRKQHHSTMPAGMMLVPVEPEMVDGITRHIIMNARHGSCSGEQLYVSLRVGGYGKPEWLLPIIPNEPGEIPKAALAAAIYMAMLRAARGES